MAAGGFVPMGRVARLHGLKGEVVARSEGDHPFFVAEGMRVWFVPPPVTIRDSVIESVRETPKGFVLRLAGVCDPDTAQSLIGTTLSVSEADLPEGWDAEEPDEVGFTVIDEERGELGEIVEIIVTGANDVWVVRGGPLGEVLIPVIEDCVVEIDAETRIARVRLLPGLLEEV
jgi:16S rRNA processing protein RimM